VLVTAVAIQPPSFRSSSDLQGSGSSTPAAFADDSSDEEAPPTQWCRITVADTGAGIPAGEQWRLFRPFSQVETCVGGIRPTGTGLGLVLCRSIIQQMGGDVTLLSSQPGVGTTFCVVVRFAVTPPSPTHRSRDASSALAGVAVLAPLADGVLAGAWGRMAAGWGAQHVATSSVSSAAQLRAAAKAAALDAARATVLLLDEPLLAALCDEDAPPLPPRVVCVLAAPPAVCSKWRAKAKACLPAAAFLDMPVSPGRLLARLRDAADAATDEPSAKRRSVSPVKTHRASVPPCALRVLVAEDNAVNARVAVAVLRRCGVAEPRVVGDGLAAVAACHEESFDVIFMDSRMPVLSGPDAVRAIRELEAEAGAARRRAFIVAVTANEGDEERQKCLRSGHDVFMTKPITPDGMRAVLRSCVEALAACSVATAQE
jgi:CheY-like chemotaxis protein